MAVSGKNEADDLPGMVVAELTGHQGPVRAVRFNGTQGARSHACLVANRQRVRASAGDYITGECLTICSSHVQWNLSFLL